MTHSRKTYWLACTLERRTATILHIGEGALFQAHLSLKSASNRTRPRNRSLTVAAKSDLRSKKTGIDRTNRLRPPGLKEVEYEYEFEDEYDIRTIAIKESRPLERHLP